MATNKACLVLLLFAGCGDSGAPIDDDLAAPADAAAPLDASVPRDAGAPRDASPQPDLVAPCPAPQIRCGGHCVDPRTDVAHCGGCGTPCPAIANGAPSCVQGVCGVASCAAGFANCNQQAADGCEVDLTSNGSNCGRCGAACAMGSVCSASVCTLQCAPPTTKCANSCVDTMTDPSACGGCGVACPAITHGIRGCAGGACTIAACDPGWTDCDHQVAKGCDVHTDTDPAHCGGCDTACSGAHATMACDLGVCVIARCAQGFADCDHHVSDGCEVATATDSKNCGACGVACAPVAHGAVGCGAGSCAITGCAANYGNCDGNYANGCETTLLVDAANCGKCGVTCGVGMACAGGACVKAGIFTPLNSGTGAAFNGVWGSGPLDVYAVGGIANGLWSAVIVHSSDEGQSWQMQMPSGQVLHAVWGSGPGDVYAVGDNDVALHTGDGGKTWKALDIGQPGQVLTVWGSGPNDVYIGASLGTVLHSTDGGQSWATTKLPTFQFVSTIWGSGPGDVYAGANASDASGGIYHTADGGKTWQKQSVAANYWVLAIWGSGPTSVWAAGESASMMHSAGMGAAWSSVATGASGALYGMWGSSANDIWAAGGNGLLHSTDGGKTWPPTATPQGPLAVWGSSANDVWVVGSSGMILHRVQ